MYSYFNYLLFLFFSYCIVGPTNMYIYTQVQCVLVNSFSITKIKDSLFSLFSQSSIYEMNHLYPIALLILDGPHKSLCMSEKG